MCSFTPYANENQLKANADNYNVELISNNDIMYRTEWKITRADGVYTYSLITERLYMEYPLKHIHHY